MAHRFRTIQRVVLSYLAQQGVGKPIPTNTIRSATGIKKDYARSIGRHRSESEKDSLVGLGLVTSTLNPSGRGGMYAITQKGYEVAQTMNISS